MLGVVKKHLVLGVIGHVDHGKTALVKALTGQDTDRLAEEKQRGISIALGFAHLNIQDTQIDFVDMPGHERFVRTMIAGATGLDAVLLVVAANEGIRAQTLEHIDIARLLGLKQILVVISKIDLVAAKAAEQVATDVLSLLKRNGLTALPPVQVSAMQSQGIAQLRAALVALAAEPLPADSGSESYFDNRSDSSSGSQAPTEGIAFLPIDRAFSVAGHGPVVTGTLRGASIRVNDVLELLPTMRKVRVRALQIHGAPQHAALPGQRVAVNLRDIAIAELERGMSLTAAGNLALSNWLTIAINVVGNGTRIKNAMWVRVLVGTTETDARVRLLDADVLEAGLSGFAQVRCTQPLAIPVGEHLILRRPSPAMTIAGGRILDTDNRRMRRNCPNILQRLTDLNTLPSESIVAAEVRRVGATGVSVARLSQLVALPVSRVMTILAQQPVVSVGARLQGRGEVKSTANTADRAVLKEPSLNPAGVVIAQAAMEELKQQILALVKQQTNGSSAGELLSTMPEAHSRAVTQCLRELQEGGLINFVDGRFCCLSPQQESKRLEAYRSLLSRTAGLLQHRGLQPPTPKELFTNVSVRQAVAQLVREGVVVCAVDRDKGREMLFHTDAVEHAKALLLPHLQKGSGLLVTDIGTLLGISRKFTMPLLNHLDESRFTKRVGDRRILFTPDDVTCLR